MLQLFRNTLFIRFLWGFMCLFLLNCSIDIPDKRLNHFAVDTSYNDQESIIELFIEKILGYGDVIAESEDSDGNEHSKSKKKISIDTYIPLISSNDEQIDETQSKKDLIYLQQQILVSAYFEIHSPPPEV